MQHLTIPKAAAISARGIRRIAPPAEIRQAIRAGSEMMKRMTAMIFTSPHVILNVSLRALKKSHTNKTVIAISKIVSNI